MKTGLSDIGSPVFFVHFNIRLDRIIYLSHNIFMSMHSVSIQSARLSQIGVNRQILKEGSSVLVRVIGNRGGEKYEGSVAGVRVQLTSAKPLKTGESFVATVSVRNGTIVVTPKEMAGTLGTAAGEIALQFNEVSQSQLFSLLESLGLPVDNLSSSILKSFKQAGLKMDSALANKIRSFALRFGGKEKSAVEILTMLYQKGIEADEDEINSLLTFLENYEEPHHNENKSKERKIINRMNSMQGAWYLLPFELVQLGEGAVLGNGCIRLLFDNANSLKLLNLDCNYQNKKYLFSLSYEGKKIKDTYFNVSGTPDSENLVINLKKHFFAAGVNPGKILWAEKEEIEGNASGLESFVSFGGEI